MVRVYGVVKVLETGVETVGGQTEAVLKCSDGEDNGTIELRVPVRKHAGFLKGKTIAFEGRLLANNVVLVNLSDIHSLQYPAVNGFNGNESRNGYDKRVDRTGRRDSQNNVSSSSRRQQQQQPADEPIPF